MNCNEVYETGLLSHHYTNTAYPLTPKSFMQYRLTDENEIYDFVREEWKKVDELCLYIHVPFCESHCTFCEYTVLEKTSEADEDIYVNLLLKEMVMYAELLRGKKIIGYDLGGGTPTKLSVDNLKRITDAVKAMFTFKEGVVFSIETTPIIAANEPEKIKSVYDMGYRRISMGMQTVSEELLQKLGRDGSLSLYERAVENIRRAGFERFNIDLMYGFLHQTDQDFDRTVRYAIGLLPEYITLYRNRYKGTKIEYEAGGVSIYKAMYQYHIAYRMLTENGYAANVGKNTFSRIKNDYGTSDYLTARVIHGIPYVGMGLGAQSFGMNYLAYNLGATKTKMERYKKAICAGKFPFQDVYQLPQDECIAKMISTSFYFAFVDLEAFYKRFGIDFFEKFSDEVKFLLDNQLIEMKGKRIYLTERGADFINGIIPLFYSENSKKELKSSFSNKKCSEKSDEEIFLSAYNMDHFDRPSVTTDIATFTIRSEREANYRLNCEPKLSLLLIRRGEHPYINCWALPGGFLKMNETIEQCAYRELTEETNIVPAALMPVGVFSDCERDPRGRVISNAFVSIVSEETVKAIGGDDAIDAKWFEIRFEKQEEEYVLILKRDDISIVARMKESESKFGHTRFEVIDQGGLAFDHAAIIATALTSLRNHIQAFDIIFDFLPEKFTLTSLQKVQETILGISVLPANFRRKVAKYVEETNEYVEGAGHRPAKLFRKK